MPRIKTSDGPRPVDVHVGQRVRERRVLMGMSQQKLGSDLGITFQQVQKYEKGTNRVGASRLFDLSQVQAVPVSYYFEGYSKKGGSEENAGLGTKTLRLARYFNGLDEVHQDAIFALVKQLAAIPAKPKKRKR